MICCFLQDPIVSRFLKDIEDHAWRSRPATIKIHQILHFVGRFQWETLGQLLPRDLTGSKSSEEKKTSESQGCRFSWVCKTTASVLASGSGSAPRTLNVVGKKNAACKSLKSLVTVDCICASCVSFLKVCLQMTHFASFANFIQPSSPVQEEKVTTTAKHTSKVN